uniref:NADH dehydrogenase subunit 4L n=1 Tax=Leptophlebia marginata TaxID=551854 RepID=UPI001EE1175D|nr:NADH dehydrogenase subunit 4L [Leptophlebia marginata]YP_010261355.1 NADH dehydrogenase subunit 4L [Leptophlebia vespertina]UIB40249.1 NADH dehydrogenase subunit 4L [Leptophlebia marginata]UIB40262.1 NADH dehydrogenase subunit 4L [Leptophlebia vespertina]
MLKLMGLCVFSLLFFSGAGVFVAKRKHLLAMLLSLEFMVLCLYMILFYYLSGYEMEYYFLMVYLTLAVCEGALGLGVLVSMIRTHGNDYFQTFSVLQC